MTLNGRTWIRLLAAAVAVAASPTAAEAAFPGKNGKIAFARDGAIWTIGPKGENRKRLTNGLNPAFSASGRRIAFQRAGRGSDKILAMKANGTRIRRLGRGFQPSFSPSGRRIVFAVFNRPGIKVMNADGSNGSRLTTGFDTSPVFSPNGKRILFVHGSPEQGDLDLFLMRRDGTRKRPVKDTPVNEDDPAFSPDGDQIAFTRDRPGSDDGTSDIYWSDVVGSNEKLLHRDAESPAFSPNGRRIAFLEHFTPRNCPTPGACEAGAVRLAIMRADGSEVKRVARTRGATAPDWGPKLKPRR